MKTDNSNIVVQESLDDAAKNAYKITEKVGYGYIQSNHKTQNKKREAFKRGANWQKEQLQPLLDSHAELLNIANEYFHHLSGLFYENKLNDNGKEFRNTVLAAIEKANNINH